MTEPFSFFLEKKKKKNMEWTPEESISVPRVELIACLLYLQQKAEELGEERKYIIERRNNVFNDADRKRNDVLKKNLLDAYDRSLLEKTEDTLRINRLIQKLADKIEFKNT